jgi:hypothetical protein
MKMADKKLFWHGEDFIEKMENLVTKIAGVGVVALLIYAYIIL